ncbi:MAG: hypothetical protein COS10_07535 [Nitrospirae bacterium CG01_land_8_20_14_3_00_44_22]|nr:MAG: hypothetical protein COS10_07535 [Nitrospirae bacterium CG01_land_8_20_14_3_00_44_22]
MGEQQIFQPLTREDKLTVVIYRLGIVLSAVFISLAAYLMLNFLKSTPIPLLLKGGERGLISLKFNILLVSLYISVGLSVFFIHLYIGKFKKTLIKIYILSIASLAILFVAGKGDAISIVAHKNYGALLLIPLSLCLGFITAKEAFCFKLIEGYLLAMVMPLYLLLFSVRMISFEGAAYGLLLIAFMLLFFTFRKVFMPIHYDIGDKSAYT